MKNSAVQVITCTGIIFVQVITHTKFEKDLVQLSSTSYNLYKIPTCTQHNNIYILMFKDFSCLQRHYRV